MTISASVAEVNTTGSTNSSASTAWNVTVSSASGAAFDLSQSGNRLFAWVEGDDTAEVQVNGSTVTVYGNPAGDLKVVYQRARVNETEPWRNVSQAESIGAEWEFVATTLTS